MFLPLFLACSSHDGEVWLIQLQLGTPEISTGMWENFVAADPPEPTPSTANYTIESENLYSPGIYFLELLRSDDGSAMAVLGYELFPGIMKPKKGEFSWNNSTEYINQQLYNSGYVYQENSFYNQFRSLSLKFDGETVQGKFYQESTEGTGSSESDQWDEANTGGSRLYMWQHFPDGTVINSSNTNECEDRLCTLETWSSVVIEGTITGVRYTGEVSESLLQARQIEGY